MQGGYCKTGLHSSGQNGWTLHYEILTFCTPRPVLDVHVAKEGDDALSERIARNAFCAPATYWNESKLQQQRFSWKRGEQNFKPRCPPLDKRERQVVRLWRTFRAPAWKHAPTAAAAAAAARPQDHSNSPPHFANIEIYLTTFHLRLRGNSFLKVSTRKCRAAYNVVHWLHSRWNAQPPPTNLITWLLRSCCRITGICNNHWQQIHYLFIYSYIA